MDLQRRYATTLDLDHHQPGHHRSARRGHRRGLHRRDPDRPRAVPEDPGCRCGVEAALLGQANPDVVVMHSRRWY